MPGLGNSRWAAEPSSKSSDEDVKTPGEAKNIAIPSFGFTMPFFTKKSAPVPPSPVVSSESKSFETKQPAVKVDAAPSQDPVEVKTVKPVSKVNAAIQAT